MWPHFTVPLEGHIGLSLCKIVRSSVILLLRLLDRFDCIYKITYTTKIDYNRIYFFIVAY